MSATAGPQPRAIAPEPARETGRRSAPAPAGAADATAARSHRGGARDAAVAELAAALPAPHSFGRRGR